jgi:acetyltransferase-like isoleucine patch superfamily enzyme
MGRLASSIARLPRRILYSEDRRRRYGPGPRLMSTLRKWRILLTHPHARIRFGDGVYIGPGFNLHIPAGGSFIVGPNVEFRRDFSAEVEGEGVITIGAGTVFTYGSILQCTQAIEIGEDARVGQVSSIVDGQHRFRDPERPMDEQGYDWHPIRIAPGAVITTKCTIMASIGERAFIGAGSVVTRDIPPFTIAVGAPARVVDEFGPSESDAPDARWAPADD